MVGRLEDSLDPPYEKTVPRPPRSRIIAVMGLHSILAVVPLAGLLAAVLAGPDGLEAVRDRQAGAADHVDRRRLAGPAAAVPGEARLPELLAGASRSWRRPSPAPTSSSSSPRTGRTATTALYRVKDDPAVDDERRRQGDGHARRRHRLRLRLPPEVRRERLRLRRLERQAPGAKTKLHPRHPLHDGPQAAVRARPEVGDARSSSGSRTATTAATVCFGTDGMLYVTSGDGTSDSDTEPRRARTDTLLAKVLRIDVDHPDAGKPYAVPKDNPFVGDKRLRARRRGPTACATRGGSPATRRPATSGSATTARTCGSRSTSSARATTTAGASRRAATRSTRTARPGPTPFAKPTVEHHHSEARSLTGGVVYHGEQAARAARGLPLRRLLDRPHLGR